MQALETLRHSLVLFISTLTGSVKNLLTPIGERVVFGVQKSVAEMHNDAFLHFNASFQVIESPKQATSSGMVFLSEKMQTITITQILLQFLALILVVFLAWLLAKIIRNLLTNFELLKLQESLKMFFPEKRKKKNRATKKNQQNPWNRFKENFAIFSEKSFYDFELATKEQRKINLKKQRQDRGYIFLATKYPAMAIFVFLLFAIFSYSLPEKYQVANLMETYVNASLQADKNNPTQIAGESDEAFDNNQTIFTTAQAIIAKHPNLYAILQPTEDSTQDLKLGGMLLTRHGELFILSQSVVSDSIKRHAIKSINLADDSVTSRVIADHSILSKDLSSQLTLEKLTLDKLIIGQNTPSHFTLDNGDAFISKRLEVDGSAYFDQTLYVRDSSSISTMTSNTLQTNTANISNILSNSNLHIRGRLPDEDTFHLHDFTNLFFYPSGAAIIGQSTLPAFSHIDGTEDLYVKDDLEVGGTIYGTISGAFSPNGNLAMDGNLITDIGNSGTNFTVGGGLNLAGNLSVTTITQGIWHGTSLADAYVDNNISLDNLTQIGTRSHANLQNLLADDHTQYVLLAGRVGGQTLIGGTGTTDSLILQTTSGVGTTGANMYFKVGDHGTITALTIFNNGDVGIGTTNSGGYKLYVNGNAYVVGTITANGASTFNNNISQVGAYTFGTGTGAISLNGPTTITGANTFTTGTGATTINSTAWTFANDTNFALSGGVNGLSFDTNTLSIDANNHRVGIGTATPQYKLQVIDSTATANGGYNKVFMAHSTGLAAGATSQFAWGKTDSAYNQAEFNFYYAGDGSTSNQLRLGLNNLPSVVTITGTGAVSLNGATTYTTLSGGNITNSALTAGRVTFAGTAGLLVDDSDLTFVTDTLSATKLLTNSVNGLAIAASTGTLSISNLKTLTVSDSTMLATNSITLAGGEIITFSPTNALSLLSTGATSVTLPTTGTLISTDQTVGQTIGLTGARLTKLWATDIESTNMPTVGGTAILSSLITPQFTRMGLGVATDAVNILTAVSTSTTDLSKTLNISHTGAITGTGYAGYFSKTGASTTNVGLYTIATGATNNYALQIDSAIAGVNNYTIYANGAAKNYFAGNIGIGDASPGTNLSVIGNAQIGYASGTTVSAGTGLAISGNVGIGTTTPGARLSVLGVDSLSTSFAANISGLTGTGLVVKNNGNVGIGTTSPGQKLDVAGNINVSAGSMYMHNGAKAIFSINSYSWFSSDSGNLTGTGNYNTGNGAGALQTFSTGGHNTAMGYSALANNSTGAQNTAIGSGSLQNMYGANSYNTVVGYNAGRYYNGTTGNLSYINNSLLLGAGASALNATGDTNEIVIGYNAIGLGSNSVVLGNDSIVTTALKGNVGIGTMVPNSALSVSTPATGEQGMIEFRLGQNDANNRAFIIRKNTSTPYGADIISSAHPTVGNGNLRFFIGDYAAGEKMVIQSNGNVGIGTTGPGTKLQIAGTGSTNGLSFGDAADVILYRNSSTQLRMNSDLRTSGSSGLTVDGPAFSLGGFNTLYNTASGLQFKANATSQMQLFASGGLALGSTYWSTDPGAGNLTIQGNVGIGTVEPTEKLQVNSGNFLFYNPAAVTSPNMSLGFMAGSGRPASSGDPLAKIDFRSDPTTYYRGAIAFSVANDYVAGALTEKMRIDYNGNVGIGTTGPGYKLDIQAAAATMNLESTTATNNVYQRIRNNSGTLYIGLESSAGGSLAVGSSAYAGIINTTDAFPLQFGTSNNVRMTILPTTGNVGIGTTGPAGKLAIYDTDAEMVIKRHLASSMTIGMNTVDGSDNKALFLSSHFDGLSGTRGSWMGLYGNDHATSPGALSMSSGAGGSIIFSTVPTSSTFERMRIDSSGNVGIGTTAPQTKVHVLDDSANSPRIMTSNTSAQSAFILGVPNAGYYSFAFHHAVNQAFIGRAISATPGSATYSPMMTFDYSGNVGIGSTAPSARLQVVGSDSLNTSFSANLSGATGTGLVVTNSGNVGIGTTSPGELLQVSATGSKDSRILIDATSANGYGAQLQMNSKTSGGVLQQWGIGTALTIAGTADFEIRDITAATPSVLTILKTSGNVGIGTTTPGARLSVLGVDSLSTSFAANISGLTGTGLVVKNNGNVGIGTTSPTLAKLDILATGSGYRAGLAVRNDGNETTFSGISFYGQNSLATTIERARIDAPYTGASTTSGGLTFSTYVSGGSLTEKMRITSEGNVGIGTTAPGALLHVGPNSVVYQPTVGTKQLILSGAGNTNAIDNGTMMIFSGGYNSTLAQNATYGAIAGLKENGTEGIASGYLGFYTGKTGDANALEKMRITSSGNVGIGTTSPGYALDVVGNINANSSIYANNYGFQGSTLRASFAKGAVQGGGAYPLLFNSGNATYTGGYHSFIIDGLEKVRIDNSGNVGIGTTTPGARLSVLGVDSLSTSFAANISGLTGTGLVVKNNGNVGIGTTAPGATLHAYGVAGANRIMGISDLALDTTDPWQGSVQIKTAPTGNNWLMSTVAYAASSKGVRFYNTGGVASYTSFEVVQGSGSKFIVDGLGNVGIGTTSPLSKLDVNGAIKYVDGTGDSNTAICKNSLGQLAPCSSLGALKNSVQDLGLGMETLMKLRPVKFNWNASGEKDLGFIAEEVASVNPLLAVYSKTGKLQGVKYPQLTSLLTSAVQEQQTQITGMTDQMSALGASFHITNSAGTVISFGNREIGALQNRDMTITADTISLNGNVIANGQNLNSAITGITENQNKIVEQLTGQLTDQNLSVDNKLQLIGASLNELTTKQVKTLKDQIAVEKKDISDLQKQMEDIQIQNKAFNDFLLAFDVKNIDNFAKKNAPLNTFTGKISATDIEALGTVKAETLDGQKLKLGAQISGTNVIKAGKLESVKILTTEASTNIKLYLTPKGPTQGKTLYYDEDDIDSGVGFKVKIEAPDLDKDIEFNWLIVK